MEKGELLPLSRLHGDEGGRLALPGGLLGADNKGSPPLVAGDQLHPVVYTNLEGERKLPADKLVALETENLPG